MQSFPGKEFQTLSKAITAPHFKAYAEHSGFHHRKVTCWPRANGEAERFRNTLEKCIRTAHIERKNGKQEMYRFLRQYRATPHSSTGISPSEALNQRKLKTELPQITSTIIPPQASYNRRVENPNSRWPNMQTKGHMPRRTL
jgi:hypothetical protein